MSDCGQYDAIADSSMQRRLYRNLLMSTPEGKRLEKAIRKARQSIWEKDYNPAVLDGFIEDLRKLLS